MIAEFGHFALILILALGTCQAVLFCPALFRASYRALGPTTAPTTAMTPTMTPAIAGGTLPDGLTGNIRTSENVGFGVWPLPFAMCVLAIIAEAALIHSFIVSDFTLPVVADYSHSSTPMIYRIGASVISDSGAMLFWVATSTLATLIYALQSWPPQPLLMPIRLSGRASHRLMATVLIRNCRTLPVWPAGRSCMPVLPDYR
jgi:cytochrome c-type biogenesis protein CcmF